MDNDNLKALGLLTVLHATRALHECYENFGRDVKYQLCMQGDGAYFAIALARLTRIGACALAYCVGRFALIQMNNFLVCQTIRAYSYLKV